MEEEAKTQNSYKKRPVWQWVLIYALVAVIAYGLIYYFVLGNKTKTPYSTTTDQATNDEQMTEPTSSISEESMEVEASIALTPTVFSPSTITVKAGAIVIWTNQSGTTATVNSAVHPTHQVYPPLTLGEFEDGGSLSLVFDSPGTYKYHNHLNPTQVGTIIVE